MNKRYQVFVSSTYKDLVDERREVMQALLELEHIPAGMELFPASDEDSWTLIRRVIDDCDYYIVIVGGRYGSAGPDGLGYTEMEYRHAVEAGKPVIAFLHRDPEQIPAGKSEQSEASRAALGRFRALCEEKQCRYWSTAAELGSVVSRSLIKLVKDRPGIGWVKASDVLSPENERELLGLRAEAAQLREEIAKRRDAPQDIEEFAQGSDLFKYTYNFVWQHDPSPGFDFGERKAMRRTMAFEARWDDVFRAVGPTMLEEASVGDIRRRLDTWLTQQRYAASKIAVGWRDTYDSDGQHVTVNDTFDVLLIQLRVLKLIEKSARARSVGDKETYFALTRHGDAHLTRLLAVRRELKLADAIVAPEGKSVPIVGDPTRTEEEPSRKSTKKKTIRRKLRK